MKTIQIKLPSDVEQILNAIEENQNDFIVEAIREKINKKEALHKILEEGYQATKEEDISLVKDFEAVDLEGWK